MDIFVTRYHSGIELSTMDKGYRVSQLYVGYTLKDAKRLFREYLKIA